MLVLGTAEWSAPIATNQHYVVREFARDFETHFVESLGLRRVRFDARDLTRIVRRVRNSVQGRTGTAGRPVPERATVVSPLIVPVHRRPTRPVNRMLLERAVARWRTSPRPRGLWTFTPVTYGLERYADFTVYHCVDLLGAFPGVDAVAVDAGERRLAGRVRCAIATSEVVAAHLREVGFPDVHTLPNVADVDLFAAAGRPAAQRRPAALFAGNLSPHKLDYPLLRALAEGLRGRGELLLAGPVAAGGGGFATELAELVGLGARYLGVLGIEELAEVTGTATVGLVPYALNPYTTGVSPLKCYEYLSAGLTVVSTAVPDVVRAARGTAAIGVADSVDDFVARVLRAVEPGTDQEIAARVEYARDFGWRARGELLRGIVTGAGGPRPASAPGPSRA
ncbi:glycosyl transferase [Plantactinospora endophytica]|uniref:Glycosyl transferase n=2 Tax=Plantactinospora endophytica TaxID=673535 RepID=A0ABQ4E9N0_9ACTN|nr:glycosyl transferase [Plantactinospora endophytica]